MPTTKFDIAAWLVRAKEQNATHMIVAVDSFDYEDYPIFVLEGQDILAEIKKAGEQPMQRVMEVYNMALPLDIQLNERRAFHP